MFKYLKPTVLSVGLLLGMFSAPLFVSVNVTAQNNDPANEFCGGVEQLGIPTGPGSNTNTDCQEVAQGSGTTVNNLITNIVNIFSVVVGIIAVIMIVYGGFRYITSGGDSGNIGTAKNTILYAIVGLIIVALAQFIVKFVVGKATNVDTT